VETVEAPGAVVHLEARAARDPPRAGAEGAGAAEPNVGTDLARRREEPVVGDGEDGGVVESAGGQRGQQTTDETVHVFERPVCLGRAWSMEVLQAVDAQEVEEQQIGLMTA